MKDDFCKELLISVFSFAFKLTPQENSTAVAPVSLALGSFSLFSLRKAPGW